MNPYPLGWGIPKAMALGILYGHKRGLFRTPAKWGIPTATFGDFFKAIDTGLGMMQAGLTKRGHPLEVLVKHKKTL